MKNRTKKLFFTYVMVSALAIITPIAIVCGTSYYTNKIANSKQINTTINRVQKVPNFVNASLYQNTNYGTSTITINQATGAINGGNALYSGETMSGGGDYINSAINSFLDNLDNNVDNAMYSFENNNAIPQNIDWNNSTLTNNTNISGGLNVWISCWCTFKFRSNKKSFYFKNNSMTFNLNNYSGAFWYSGFGTSNAAPLQVQGNMSFSLDTIGIPQFNLTGNESIYPAPFGESWEWNDVNNPKVKFSTNGNWTITLPFNMQKIQSNIQNAISNISLSYYEFKQQWKTGLLNQINQKINGCIPSYMSSCFVSSSTVTTYGATGGQINTTVTYIDGEGKSIPWHFTTTVTMPAQPSDESAYKLFKKEFSQPITLFSNTSNVWDSNKYWNSSTVPVDISSKPKTSSYIKTNNNIYYNGNSSTSNSTWCTNKAILVNYINMIFNLVENEIKSKANTPNPDPFSNNPISLSYSFITTQNETHEIQTKLTFNNRNFNNVSNINSNYKNSPWIFNTPVSLSLTTFYYSGSIINRINIQALPMPVAGSFQLEPDNGYLIKGSNQTTTSGSNNGSGFINAGTYLYYSSALLTFTGNMSEQDILEINNQPISVINNQFTYNLTAPSVFDNTTNNTNSSSSNTNNSSISKTYNIEIYKNSILIFEESVVITRGVPNVNFKWYAWNPSQKPWQEKLITQNLSNGKANPQYNPLINPNTGSINQILWVNGPTPNNESYFADPLQSNNQLYNNKQTPEQQGDIGYIADGQVFNKGVEVNWNTNNANVYREGLTLSSDGQLTPSANPNPEFNGLNYGDWQQIYPNNSNNNSTDYFSYSGLWEYNTKSLYNYDGIYPNVN